MISLMGKNYAKALKACGYMAISPYEGWNMYNITSICREVPFKVVYIGYENDTQRLFDVILTLTNKFMVVKWLTMSIEALEHFGVSRKKTKMSLRCNLPGIADILLDRGYKRIHRDGEKNLEYSELFGETRDTCSYVGLKDLK